MIRTSPNQAAACRGVRLSWSLITTAKKLLSLMKENTFAVCYLIHFGRKILLSSTGIIE